MAYDGTTPALAFRYVGQCDSFPDGNYYVKVSSTDAQQLHIKHHGGRAWALVMLKLEAPQPALFTQEAVGDPTSLTSSFKLSDTQINFMTDVKNNPDVWGVALIPEYQEGYLTGNLLRGKTSRAYPVGSSITSNMGEMIKFQLDATVYPTGAWDTTLENNNHGGGQQAWANWLSSESWKMRWNSGPEGKTYFNEVVNGKGWANTAHIYAWVH